MALLLLALLPFAPVWGWVCFGGLAGVVVHLRGAWRGFPRLVGLLAALLEVYLSISSSWSLCRVPQVLRLSSPGRRVVFSEAGMAVRALLLATSLPLPMVFPEAGSNVSVSTFLGWFAVLEVIVLKSRFSRFSWSLRFSLGALSSGFPIQWPPFRGWLSGSSVLCVGLAELLRTSGLVLQSLCSLLTCY